MSEQQTPEWLQQPAVITNEALDNPQPATSINLEMMILMDLQGHDADALAEHLRTSAAGLFSGPLALVDTQPAEAIGYYADAVVNPLADRAAIEAHWQAKLGDIPLTLETVAKLITRAGLLPIHEFHKQSLTSAPPAQPM